MRYFFALALCVIALNPFPIHAQGLIEYATEKSGCPSPAGECVIGMCTVEGKPGVSTGIPCIHSLDNIIQTVLNIVNFLFGISGSILLLYFIIGGFFWVSSFGNSDRVEKGKEFMKNAVVGFIIMVSAYAIVVTFGGIFLEGGNKAAEETLLKQNDKLLEEAKQKGAAECRGGTADETNGKSCGKGMVCMAQQCVTACDEKGVSGLQCRPRASCDKDSIQLAGGGRDLCPGGGTLACCQAAKEPQPPQPPQSNP